jgi:glycosyltransferase involved in cell wall biosynthesis
MAYVHSRMREYVRSGLDVTVLSFRAEGSYEIDGIKVVDEAGLCGLNAFDLAMSHAPNVRNHLRVLRAWPVTKPLVMFFHGHEVLLRSRYYPAPYHWQSGSGLVRRLADDLYDRVKLQIMARFIGRRLRAGSTRLVFVSDWMRRAFLDNVALDDAIVLGHSEIISNTIGPAFLTRSYSPKAQAADVVAIRPLDQSKYAVDLIVEAARNSPDLTFHLYGKGHYFEHNERPANLEHIDRYVTNDAIPDLLDQYRAALIPTRLDAQGVMMCEMATYGISVVTSDIPICREMLAEFANVRFVRNDGFARDLHPLIDGLRSGGPAQKVGKFALENTLAREIALVRSIVC